MNYAQRWTMAQALRQPISDTGDATAATPSPPVFVPVETQPTQKGSFPIGTFIVGIGIGATATAFLAMSGVMD